MQQQQQTGKAFILALTILSIIAMFAMPTGTPQVNVKAAILVLLLVCSAFVFMLIGSFKKRI